MELVFLLTYHPEVVAHDLPKLNEPWRSAIQKTLIDKISRQPEVFGKPLRFSLIGHRTARVGDYRIVFRIDGKKIRVDCIAHRKIICELIEKRI